MQDKEDIHTVAGKREFLKNFLNSVRDELIGKADKMPEEWDGFELRWLVCDKFNYEQHHRSNDDSKVERDWRKRFRSYDNERVVRNL